MAAAIRKLIGPARKRIEDYLANAPMGEITTEDGIKSDSARRKLVEFIELATTRFEKYKALCKQYGEENDDPDSETLADEMTKCDMIEDRYEEITTRINSAIREYDQRQLSAKEEIEAQRKAAIEEQERTEESQFRRELAERESVAREKLAERESVTRLKAEIELMKEKADAELRMQSKALETSNTPANGVAPDTVKLPPLELPKFHGDRLKWFAFWDAFEAAIDSNPALKPCVKLTYLAAQLNGEAKRAIDGLSITNENYDVALELLRNRFGDKTAVVSAHYDAIRDLPTASTLSEVRMMFGEFEMHLRSLAALGETPEGVVFSRLLIPKLPKEMVLKIAESKKSTDLPLEELCREVRDLLAVYEAVNLCTGTRARVQTGAPSTLYTPARTDTGSRYNGRVPAALYTRNDGLSQNRTSPTHYTTQQIQTPRNGPVAISRAGTMGAAQRIPSCVYCGGTHWTDECRTFDTLEKRKGKIKGNCFICLKPGHTLRDCRTTTSCFYCKKVGNHHRSLCPTRFPPRTEAAMATIDQTTTIPTTDTNLLATGERVLLQTATSLVRCAESGKSYPARIILDTGGSRTYIAQTFAKKLSLKHLAVDQLLVNTFGSKEPVRATFPLVEFQLLTKGGDLMNLSANIVPHITAPLNRHATDYSSLSTLLTGYQLADKIPTEDESVQIDVLIGSDHYWELIKPEKIEIKEGLYLVNSKLGWLLTGRTGDLQKNGRTGELKEETVVHSLFASSTFLSGGCPVMEDTDRMTDMRSAIEVKQLWDLESLGIKENVLEDDDDRTMQHFEENVKRENGRYYVRWPWRSEVVDLPTNYQLSLGRLKSVHARLIAQPDLLEKYDGIIKDQLSKGVIEKVPLHSTCPNREHYLPHHPVITPDRSTTKVRIVYDGSAKSRKGKLSLNECLHRGPIILDDLCHLLLRFRTYPVALTADIEKAFLQVGLQETDRDVTRFLWLQNPFAPVTSPNLQVYRFTRVPFGVITSPFLLAATVKHHLMHTGGEVAERIRNHIYVDNVITGVNSKEEALPFYHQAKEMFHAASMNLREWNSNLKGFMQQLPLVDKAAATTTKVLGMKWNTEEDTMCLNQELNLDSSNELTKRRVLSIVSSIFDPLGLYSPAVIKAKIFLQSLWIADYHWDAPLSSELVSQWNDIISQMGPLHTISFPRYIGPGPEEQVTYDLHIFCDASGKAYVACAYLLESSPGQVTSYLIFSKSRVVPKKGITIPRLELMSVLVGTRIYKFICRALHLLFKKCMLWSDSQCVLHWIKSTAQRTTFVENRLHEIRKSLDLGFRYVPTLDNPADILSRGTSSEELKKDSLWWNGPSWLTKEPTSWPDDVAYSNSEEKEIKPHLLYSAALCSPEGAEGDVTPFDENRFSSSRKLLNVTAICLQFSDRCLSKEALGRETYRQRAETIWLKGIQAKYFHQDLLSLKKGKASEHFSQLSPFLDETGLIRCQGRITFSGLTEDAIHPILLPRHSPFTQLLIRDVHEKLLHSGVSHTLAELRQRYWVPSGRAAVYNLIRTCPVCKRYEEGPYMAPEVPALPRERVTPSRPFNSVGIDYFGPTSVKDKQGRMKRWVCLISCMATRALHLEVVDDLTAGSFLMAFRRFTARRGTPSTVISDNASYFTSINVQRYIYQNGITWQFITERAPWMGGFYERLIRMTKNTLRKTVQNSVLTLPQLQTIIAEIEAVLNSRPLVYVGSDIEEFGYLTPGHFLNPMHRSSATEIGGARADLIERWKKGETLLKRFWKIWSDDYLLSLRERYTKLRQTRNAKPRVPQVGDLVHIRDDLPRGQWKLGIINRLNYSQDTQIRSAEVRIQNGTLLNRSVTHLYPMEIIE